MERKIQQTREKEKAASGKVFIKKWTGNLKI